MRRTDAICPTCDRRALDIYLDMDAPYPVCECGKQMEWLPSGAAAVVGDEIPGGVYVRHGICNEDGSPRRYDSHSEMRREAAKRGLINYVERGVSDKKDYDRLTRKI